MKNFQEVFKKYTMAGPNYQYYPTPLGFQENINHETILKTIMGTNGRELNLQLLFPFCQDPDCHSTNYQIQLENSAQLRKYIHSIKNEILIYKQYLNKSDKITQIHLSGSEFSLLKPIELCQILNYLADSFDINIKETNVSLDVNTRLIDSHKFQVLKDSGFNKLFLSTLNFDYKLQMSAGNVQTYQQVDKLLMEVKKVHFDSIVVELIYGLPGESCASMKSTIDSLIALNCEQICLTRYLHRPIIFKLQKLIKSVYTSLPDENYSTFKMCIEQLQSAGYKHLGMNCFVNSNSELYSAPEKGTLRYNNTGYTLNTVKDVVSFGASSISIIDNLIYQNFIKLVDYYQSIDNKLIPAYRGCDLINDQQYRKKIIMNLIIHNRFDFNNSDKNQLNRMENSKDTFAHLHEMEKDGMVKLSEKSIIVTDLGKHFLKNICALFDLDMRYLV